MDCIYLSWNIVYNIHVCIYSYKSEKSYSACTKCDSKFSYLTKYIILLPHRLFVGVCSIVCPVAAIRASFSYISLCLPSSFTFLISRITFFIKFAHSDFFFFFSLESFSGYISYFQMSIIVNCSSLVVFSRMSPAPPGFVCILTRYIPN